MSDSRTVTEPPPVIAPGSFTIVFDGGSIGNPGRGYGSYQITGEKYSFSRLRLEFGDNITNNQAEYQTLIAALTWLRDALGENVSQSEVFVAGDSQLVINQLNSDWKVRHAGLVPLHQLANGLLRAYKSASLSWHHRSESVRILGH